tara:strand:- start:116 stop:769 length:654 start_codon:yes stop_codon:yes gene_type:complete
MSSAKLISFSKSVDNENDSIIDMVAYVARVSNPANQNNKLTNEKLINYLIKNKHWSPFEMVSICIEIKTSRDIARQILRHRSFSFQEFSQRYAKVSEDFYEKEARMQDSKNRQSSLMTDNDKLKKEWEEKQDEIKNIVKKNYSWALENGIAKECARVILPEGLTPSTLYMSGSLRSWIHYLQLRCGNGTQQEHMDVANKCKIAISKIFPNIFNLIHI